MVKRANLATKTLEQRAKSLAHRKKTTSSLKYSDSPIDQILSLQRTVGNQAVERLLKSGVIQAKLKIGTPGDIYEREADRVAEQVMRIPDNSVAGISKGNTEIQRKCAECASRRGTCSHCAEEETIQRKRIYSTISPLIQRQSKSTEEEIISRKEVKGGTPEVTSGLESQINGIKGGGQPLPKYVRDLFEPRFGYDFSGVRLHADTQAAESAREISALAYTVG